MKVIVFGATGSVGELAVKELLGQGHAVTAFARRTSKLKIAHPQLRLLDGNANNAGAVDAAVAGHDAVVIALGPEPREGTGFAPSAPATSFRR